MAKKEYIIGNKYSHSELMDLAISEMLKSQSEHTHKPDPKVGAVLSTPEGVLIQKAYRGEEGVGDHAEYTLFEKKLQGQDLSGNVLYTTLEPCVERNSPKIGCTFRTIDAKVSKVYIGHLDPDPNVQGDGAYLLKKEGIIVDYFDRTREKFIDKKNDVFFRDREQLAKQLRVTEVSPVTKPIEEELPAFDLIDLSEEAQQDMISRMELPYRLGSEDYQKFLIQFGLSKRSKLEFKSKPTGLGLLLLGKNPQYHFPQSRIKFTIHRPNLEPKIKDFEGPLVLMPGKIEEYLDLIIQDEISRESFHRVQLSDIPKKALREVIINALVHRDYTIEGAKIMVDIYPDRIEIISPGIPNFPIKQFKSFSVPSISRNPKIAYIFNQMSLVEERGLGMIELKTLKEKGFKSPDFRLEGSLFYTIIYRANDKELISIIAKDNLVALTETEQAGYDYLKVKEKLSSSEYADHFDVDQRTARRHLNKMVDKKLAIREGEGPATIYIISDLL